MALNFQMPPMPDSETPDVHEAREVLAQFVIWTGYFLQMIGEYRDAVEEDGIRYFEEQLVEDYVAALVEFLKQGHIGRVAELIAYAEAENLIRHGLTGRQLRLKLGIPHFRVQALGNLIDKPARATLSALFASINSLLKSIMGAVPGGAAIDELKQAAENMRTVADEAGV